MTDEREELAALLQHAYHTAPGHSPLVKWLNVADKAIALAQAHRPAEPAEESDEEFARQIEAMDREGEPAPLSDEQILRAFIEKVPAAWFKPEWHDGILAGLRAVIAAHQQPQP